MKCKIFVVIAILLLFTGTAYTFPYDPNPSQIHGTSTRGGTASITNLFPGNWSNTWAAMGADTTRWHNFMIQEFAAKGGKGGETDLDLWNTPSFSTEKMTNQNNAWNSCLAGTTPSTTNGLAMMTTHNELIQCIEAMPRNNLTVEYLGEIPRGFPFPILIFSKSKDRTPAGLKATKLPLVWIQGNIHGGEWSGGEGALACAYALAQGGVRHGVDFDALLNKVNVIVVPRVCADGAKVPRRETYDLIALQWTPSPDTRDLNRDNVLLDIPVTRVMRKLNMAYGPHFAIDLHERGSESVNSSITSTYGAKIDNDAGDIGSSGTTILQTPKELTYLRYKYMEPDLVKFGEKYAIYMGLYRESMDNYSSGLGSAYATWNGYVPHDDDVKENPYYPGEAVRYGPYINRGHGTGTWVTSTAFDPDAVAPYFIISEATYNHRSSRNINSMPGVVSQLFENRSAPTNVGGRAMWERRVATGYICMLSTITTAANNHFIMDELEAMRARWIEKGKVYDPNDKIPLLTITPKPVYWNEKLDYLKDGFPHHRDYGYQVIDFGHTGAASTSADRQNISGMSRYDVTKAVKRAPGGPGTGNIINNNYIWVKDNSGEGDYQPLKFEVTWQGWNLRERARPTAYIFEGEYAEEVAGRMLIAGIDVKRLAKNTSLNVTGWKFNKTPSVDFSNSGSGGWGSNNRDVTL